MLARSGPNRGGLSNQTTHAQADVVWRLILCRSVQGKRRGPRWGFWARDGGVWKSFRYSTVKWFLWGKNGGRVMTARMFRVSDWGKTLINWWNKHLSLSHKLPMKSSIFLWKASLNLSRNTITGGSFMSALFIFVAICSKMCHQQTTPIIKYKSTKVDFSSVAEPDKHFTFHMYRAAL